MRERLTRAERIVRSRQERERAVMRALGLPLNLIEYIRGGCLYERIMFAYKEWRAFSERLDAWEALNPELAKAVPWYEGREAWKRAGRPLPEWYEVLLQFDGNSDADPIDGREIQCDLYTIPQREYQKRNRKKINAYKCQWRAARKAQSCEE